MLLSNIRPLLAILFTTSLYGITSGTQLSQILDCTNSTAEPSSICNENILGNQTNIEKNLSNIINRRDVGQLCDGGENRDNHGALLICSSLPSSPSLVNKQNTSSDSTSEASLGSRKPIEVFIRTPNNATRFHPGASLTVECRFNVDSSSALSQDFKFRLKWLRSVAGSPHGNQSISTTETDSSLTIIAATTRLWTVQRSGGLDLELNDFQEDDSGSYFCQALTSDSGPVISEARVQLTLEKATQKSTISADDESAEGDRLPPFSFYSQENLSKLLPSLKVLPQFTEVAAGETIQLVCVTSHSDPDPDPSTIEWSFEAIESRRQLMHLSPTSSSELPYNVSALGNVLVVWSMSEEHCGIYKCSVKLADFNLTVQASGELVLRPTVDTAPLVFVSPEIVRLSLNGSARIQCEATGYPPPEVVWYRLESAQANSPGPSQYLKKSMDSVGKSEADKSFVGDSCIEFEQVSYKDAILYCDQNKCLSQAGHRSSVTGVSLIHLKQARAHHQGQWVCRASNKHGSNQASSLVDVEFRERPIVSIVPESSREQTIVLSDEPAPNQIWQHNATFRCSIEAGKPYPKLRWLRTALADATRSQQLASSDNLDIYDLTRVSSATSNVTTHLEEQGKSLVLVLGTISPEDEGDYICLGENEWGRHSAVAHLTVRQPSSVRILQASPMIAQPNTSFHLDCLAIGHPTPVDIEWRRYDRGALFSLVSRGAASGPGQSVRAMLKFDRVGPGESGEYTCNARDPLNGSLILRDTIMVLVEDGSERLPLGEGQIVQQPSRPQESLLPKLMARPTKLTAPLGSNVTLDCLAVSGLQPTVVEWIAPPQASESTISSSTMDGAQLINHAPINGGRAGLIWSYYRAGSAGSRIFQFGSKLRISNVTKQHEGVYQCKGSNRIGIENAPALIRVLDPEAGAESDQAAPINGEIESPQGEGQTQRTAAKAKVARVGSNIELKCQVNGVEQPATSWSRDGLELPASSVQIEHNLWIQNVSHKDSGLYICSARSKQPNKVIQARINLLVSGQMGDNSPSRLYNLSAKIVASKNAVNVGDSITLECIVSGGLNVTPSQIASSKPAESSLNSATNQSSKVVDLEEIERNVVWTNTHTGQSIFQDNVYILQNLLIIYDLRPENSATYRCNYNDFAHFTDYRLQVANSGESNASLRGSSGINTTSSWTNTTIGDNSLLMGAYGHHAQVKQVTLGWHLTLDCPSHPGDNIKLTGHRWTRGEGPSERSVGQESTSLVFESIKTSEADIYRCYHSQKQAGSKQATGNPSPAPQISSFIVQVLVPVARFVQRPVSFVSLPSISGANQQLEIELKFLPERDHGLILFNGQRQWNRSAIGDYISLGLNKGFLEFRFELGDGTTLLRSLQSLTLNQWHQVLIERNRRGAVMWLDKQPPVSNSSSGKFFNLNLDSVLYVGGNQYFLNKSRAISAGTANQTSASTTATTTAANMSLTMPSTTIIGSSGRFYGYSRGFQGCISLLRIGPNEINLISRNRSASIGIYECDKPECRHNECGGGLCQVDRISTMNSNGSMLHYNGEQHRKSSMAASDNGGQRCICPPGFLGEHCETKLSPNFWLANLGQQSKSTADNGSSGSTSVSATTPQPAKGNTKAPETLASASSDSPNSGTGGACELLSPCSATGTQSCQSLTSASFKCHCRLGFMGDTCSQAAVFSSETSLWFNQQAFLQFRFNRPEEVQLYQSRGQESLAQAGGNLTISTNSLHQVANLTHFARSTSMAESQSISFKLQTRSGYGLIFYMGQANSLLDSSTATNASGPLDLAGSSGAGVQTQTSKSMVANLLARLSSMVFDYLAIALVDGHVELSMRNHPTYLRRASFELGSGVAIIRSSQRVNDGSMHQIRVVRSGRSARLTIDELHKHDGSSPGKLSMLNSPPDIYLGGLPHLAELTHNMYMSGFVGCVLNLEINSLGPINLLHSDHLTQLRSARNLAPCSSMANGNSSLEAQPSANVTPNYAPTTVASAATPMPASPASNSTQTKHKPYQSPAQPESDDPDEM